MKKLVAIIMLVAFSATVFAQTQPVKKADVTKPVVEKKIADKKAAVKAVKAEKADKKAVKAEKAVAKAKATGDKKAIKAAKTKPYGYTAFYPGPGVGGHCIPLDPYYLSYSAKHFGIIPRFIETAGEINDFMPIHTVNLAKKGLKKVGKKIRDSKILILGIAYKSNISDTRESPAIKVIEELVENGADIRVYDPHAKSIKTRFGNYYSEDNFEESLKWADCAILVTDHDVFKQNTVILNTIKNRKTIIVDTRNIFDINMEDISLENPFYIKL